MTDIEILKQLLNGNHLNKKELKKAGVLVYTLCLSMRGRLEVDLPEFPHNDTEKLIVQASKRWVRNRGPLATVTIRNHQTSTTKTLIIDALKSAGLDVMEEL